MDRYAPMGASSRLQHLACLVEVLIFAICCSKAQAVCSIVPSPGGSAYAPVIEGAADVKVTLPAWEAPKQPPVSLLGFDDSSTWKPSSFVFGDTVGGSWIATTASDAKSVQLLLGDAAVCTLAKVEVVSLGREETYFQLQFANCENSDDVVLEIPVRESSSEHAATGISLLPWMSSISPSLFARVVAGSNATDPTMKLLADQMKFAKVGDGHCTSDEGGLTHEVSIVTSASDCQFQCSQGIRAAVVMSSGGGGNENAENVKYCKGYSWQSTGSTCWLYFDWDIDGTNGDSSGAECYKPGVDGSEVESLIEELHASAALDWKTVFGGDAGAALLTARTLEVTPKDKGCFAKFNLYTLNEGIYVSAKDWHALNSTFQTVRSEYQAQPGGTNMTLVMDRACVRDMAGTLRGACAEDENTNYEGVYTCMLDGGELTSCETYNHTAQGENLEAGILQECTSCFMFWLLLIALGLLLLLLAFCCTSLGIKVLCPKRVVEGPEQLEFTEVLVEADRSYYDRFRDAFASSA